jgi:hypothetical protein
VQNLHPPEQLLQIRNRGLRPTLTAHALGLAAPRGRLATPVSRRESSAWQRRFQEGEQRIGVRPQPFPREAIARMNVRDQLYCAPYDSDVNSRFRLRCPFFATPRATCQLLFTPLGKTLFSYTGRAVLLGCLENTKIMHGSTCPTVCNFSFVAQKNQKPSSARYSAQKTTRLCTKKHERTTKREPLSGGKGILAVSTCRRPGRCAPGVSPMQKECNTCIPHVAACVAGEWVAA